jgi:ABC-2 type transport system permease protein
MRGFWKLTWIEAKLFFRIPIMAFFTLAFPLMILFIFGGIYGNAPSQMFGGLGSVDVSIPAYTGMIIGTSALLSLTITLANYRERGILRRYRATPVSPSAVLGAQLVVLFVMTLVGMGVLVLAGKVFYGMRFEGNVWSVLAGFTLGCVSFRLRAGPGGPDAQRARGERGRSRAAVPDDLSFRRDDPAGSNAVRDPDDLAFPADDVRRDVAAGALEGRLLVAPRYGSDCPGCDGYRVGHRRGQGLPLGMNHRAVFRIATPSSRAASGGVFSSRESGIRYSSEKINTPGVYPGLF